MPLAAAAPALIGAAGSIGGGLIGSSASKKAAEAQAKAAAAAAQQEKDARDQALAYQQNVYGQTQAQQAPWLGAGQSAVNTLSQLMQPGGALYQGFGEQFQAPTDVTEQNDPGYQFRLQQGVKALQNSAAAKGQLFDPNTSKALTRYGQDYASNEYGNVYNRAMQEFQQRYNIFNQNQANQYNRLAGLSGMGQTSAGQLASAGQAAAGNTGNILMNAAQNIGNDITGGANARASGYMGAGNAYTGMTSGLMDAANQYFVNKNKGSGGYSGLSNDEFEQLAYDRYGSY
jgi:hypothetical protein